MGVSVAGVLIAATIFVPNILVFIFPAKNVPAKVKPSHLIFTISKRLGQAGCLILPGLSQSSSQNKNINV